MLHNLPTDCLGFLGATTPIQLERMSEGIPSLSALRTGSQLPGWLGPLISLSTAKQKSEGSRPHPTPPCPLGSLLLASLLVSPRRLQSWCGCLCGAKGKPRSTAACLHPPPPPRHMQGAEGRCPRPPYVFPVCCLLVYSLLILSPAASPLLSGAPCPDVSLCLLKQNNLALRGFGLGVGNCVRDYVPTVGASSRVHREEQCPRLRAKLVL